LTGTVEESSTYVFIFQFNKRMDYTRGTKERKKNKKSTNYKAARPKEK
jgi:hypothetical protein